jgi:ABC-type transporter Mla subunit MlaD
MAENTSDTPTVETSLELLSEAVGKAADDLRAARTVLDRARADIAARNTSVSRRVVSTAERVVTHLRETDEALRDVVKQLDERD